MSDDDLDPGANTQMFQAFVDSPEFETSRPRWVRVAVLGTAVAGLLIVLALAWLMLGG